MIFKCKMCGGDLHPAENAGTCECEFCGSVQTVPNADSEKKANLFNRANRLRMGAEFDRAAAVYASITAEFPEEAEAYWGLCLCRYGIEYVDDPGTGNKIPTCHRTLAESIMDDPDFIQACENADPVAKKLYREEAKAIDRLQRDILAIVTGEAPYDAFICYKETDENGGRTEDSVLAQEIYDSLTGKGLRVFFARITLEDKLGQQYEPYIYAALHSAKVMLAVGTRFEYFDTVWVKNEWARFLDMMRTDKGKTLIPCYKGIDAYDMPREFKNLQAQDMGKIGWLQDLTRGVLKLCGKDEKGPAPQAAAGPAAPGVDSLMKRAALFLEDGDTKSAGEYLDRVLDIDPEYAPAYAARVCVALGLKREAELGEADPGYTDNADWNRAIRFADGEQRKKYEGYAAAAGEKKAKREKAVKEAQALLEELFGKRKAYETAKRLKEAEDRKHKASAVLEQLKTELANLRGLFTGRRKAELSSQIDEMERRLKNAEEEYTELKRRAGDVGTELSSPPDEREYYYRIAKAFYDAEMPGKAGIYFYRTRGYKDTDGIVSGDPELRRIKKSEEVREEKLKPFRTVGSCVSFGTYPQTSSGTDATPIRWIVQDVQGDKALLLSRYGLDSKPYDTVGKNITWEKCTLRTWLNGEFLNKAFSAQEQKAILTVKVSNSKNQGYHEWRTNGGNDTDDKVFLFSYAEAYRYLGVTLVDSRNTKPRVAPTAYAVKNGAHTSISDKTTDGKAAGWWWLRSPGHTPFDAAYVRPDGLLSTYSAAHGHRVVRPALWIDLESDIF